MRLVLVDDPKQFKPAVFSPEGKRAFGVTLFKKLQDEGWPLTFLDINFRQHSLLMEAINTAIYEGRMRANRETLKRDSGFLSRAWLHLLSNQVYLSDNSGHKRALKSFCHFIDVQNSTCRKHSNGTSSNQPEAECVVALINVLLSIRDSSGSVIRPIDILVLAAYRGQHTLIRRMYEESRGPNGNSGSIDIRTIHTSQSMGKKLVIISLTKESITGENGRQGSMIVNEPLVTVELSRAEDMLFVVGDWRSIEDLPESNVLRRTMMVYNNQRAGFVLKGFRAPFFDDSSQDIA